MVSAPIFTGNEGTGVAPIRTCTRTEAVAGVGWIEPWGGGVGVEVYAGGPGEFTGVGVDVEVLVSVGVDVIVGVGVRVFVCIGVGLTVAEGVGEGAT